MHNTRIHALTGFGLAFLLALTQGLVLALIFTRYALYLFFAGLPGFSRGGMLNETERCFDPYNCALDICNKSSVVFNTHMENCGLEEENYQERLPGWMQFEYEKMRTTQAQNIVLVSLHAFAYIFFPVLCWSLSKCEVRPLTIRFLARIFTAILVLGNLLCAILLTNSISQMDKYKPTMPSWTNDLLLLSFRLSTALLLIQCLGCSCILIFNQLTQKYTDIEEYRPLRPGDMVNENDEFTWGRVERDNGRPPESEDEA